MPNIVKTLKGLYATDKAACLNMLPELFKQYDEGKIVNSPYKIGDIVRCIAYDSDDEEYSATGYVYVSENEKYIICSSSYYGKNDKQICKTLLEEQQEDGYVEMYIFDKTDVYKSSKEAEQALKERKQNEQN